MTPARVPLSRQGFTAEMAALGIEIAPETCDRLAAHIDLLNYWQRSVKLVGPATLADPWRRHMLDSAQLFAHLPKGISRLVDLGAGAGFPGVVLAILGVPHVAVIEANGRKAAFLREVARITATPLDLRVARIESINDFHADVVTARALAPLEHLLNLAQRFCGLKSLCLFPKGGTVDGELTDSVIDRIVSLERIPSRSDPDGVVLRFHLHPRVTRWP